MVGPEPELAADLFYRKCKTFSLLLTSLTSLCLFSCPSALLSAAGIQTEFK